jgi:hypothetical protein
MKQSQPQRERAVLLARLKRVDDCMDGLRDEKSAIMLLLKGKALLAAEKNVGRKKTGPKPKKPVVAKKAKKAVRTSAPKQPRPATTEAAEQATTAPGQDTSSVPAVGGKKGGKKGGRRLIDDLQKVIGRKQCTPLDCYGYLKALGWLPNSDDPLGYIRFTLSKESKEGEIFRRIEGRRGVYELAPENPFYQENLKVPDLPVTAEESPAEAQATPEATSPPPAVPEPVATPPAPVASVPVAPKAAAAPKAKTPSAPPPAATHKAKTPSVPPPAPAPVPTPAPVAAKSTNGSAKAEAAKAVPAPAQVAESSVDDLEGEDLEAVVESIIDAGGDGLVNKPDPSP